MGKFANILIILGMIVLFMVNIEDSVMAAEDGGSYGKDTEIVFLLDASASMKDQDKGREAVDGICQAAYGLTSNCRTGAVVYNTDVQAVIPLETEHDEMEELLSSVVCTGYTNAGAGLNQALDLFSSEVENVDQCIIMVTDGEIDMPDNQGKELSRSLYEDAVGRASALLPEDYKMDMELIKESGATAMRLAHYPHAEPMYDLSDENGIILWTEIPMCGPGGQAFTGLVDTEGFKDNARLAVKELVYQKFNHPSICFWGICNEILVSDGKRFVEYDNPIPFIKELNGLYKSIDTSRLTALATCVDQSYYLGCSDLIAWNKYFGWYKDAAPSASKFFDDCKNSSQGIPVGVSEYGGGASINHHQWPLSMEDRADSHFHPEEAQTFCHEGNWESFMKRPYLWAKFIWVFADFPSYMRQEGEEDGYNDKGLITQDRKVKKDAFYFYKANWNPEPMVYITSRRFVKRNNPQTDIKVFTNLKEVTLYINGKKIGTMKPDEMHRVIWKDIKLDEGRNTVRVEGKNGKENLSDSCEWYYIK